MSEVQMLPSHAWTDLDFVGGHPCLDFLNTFADTGKTRERDKIPTWPAVRTWAKRARFLPPLDLREFLKNQALDRPMDLLELHRWREAAYGAMLDVLAGKNAEPPTLKDLRERIRAAMDRGSFALRDGRFGWRPSGNSHHRWTDAAALSLEDLLRSDHLARVRQCGRCTWLFVDRGRGVGRRWCVMRTCGNRAKAEAFRGR